jgi:hypothetical protein
MAVPASGCAISRFASIARTSTSPKMISAAAGIAFEFQDHAVSQSIYFDDPDGLRLELTTYEV